MPSNAARREGARRFFQRFADRTVDGRLARIEVAGGLVEPDAFGRLLFNEQEAAVALDHGGHRDVGLPDGGHGQRFRRAAACVAAVLSRKVAILSAEPTAAAGSEGCHTRAAASEEAEDKMRAARDNARARGTAV